MKKENELEAYKKPNTFSRAFYKTSVLGQKLFCYSLYKVTNDKNIDETGANISFTVNEFMKALNISSAGKNYLSIKTAVKEIYDFNITIKDDDKEEKLIMFRVFQSASIDKNNILLQFSKKATEVLLKYRKKQFTLLALSQIGKLKNFYSIRYYEIALSWSGQKGKIKGRPDEWFFEFDFENFKKMFKLEDMRTDNIIPRVIKQPLEEVNKVSDIEISCDITREGKRTPTHLKFWCKFKNQQKELPPPELFDFTEYKEEKRELTEDAKEYDRAMELKKAYPEEWQKQESISKEKLNKIYGATTMQILIDMDVYKELKDRI